VSTRNNGSDSPVVAPRTVDLLAPDGDGLLALSPATGVDFAIDQEAKDTASQDIRIERLKVGLIDCHLLSQECLQNALESQIPGLTVIPFASLQDCVARQSGDFDLFIYFWHTNEASAVTALQGLSAAAVALEGIPLVVLSDAEDAPHPKTVRTTLKSGARGFIPTRTTGIQMTAAAIRFVRAGGTFAPLDLLLSSRQERGSTLPEVARKHCLTSRQAVVLSHLQQGKANKIIAHELSMSESTVKVHVRNIMRKMGATNRTQAVYKAQKLWDAAEIANMSEV